MQLSLPYEGSDAEETKRWWRYRLAQEGFRDLECGDPDGMLRTTVSLPDSPEALETTVGYFAAAERWTSAIRRRFAVERRQQRLEVEIWQLHAQGKTVREICTITGQRSTTNVQRVIARHRRAMMRARKGRRAESRDTDER